MRSLARVWAGLGLRVPGSLRIRLMLSHLVMLLAGVGLVAGFAGSVLADARVEQLEHSLEDIGFLLSNQLEEPLMRYANHEIDQSVVLAALRPYSAEPENVELLVVTTDGQQLSPLPGVAPDADARAGVEVQAAFRSQDVRAVRRDAQGREMLYVAVPIIHENDVYGVLRLSAPMAPVRAAITRTLAGLGAVVLLVALAASAAAWWLAEGLVRPLRRLTVAAGQVAAGQWDAPVGAAGVEELSRLVEAFDDMARRLRATLENQRAFIANASHELRTPLTSVKLRVEALRAGAWQDPVIGPRFLAETEGEVDRLARLADDLLDLSRIDSRLSEHKRQPLDLALMAEEARDAFSVRARRAEVSIAVEVQGQPRAALGDDAQLRRLLTNLLDNAIKHTPPGGRVTLRLAPAELSGYAAVALQVRDTGSGIPPEHLPHIFERFYHGNAAPPRAGARRGSGLGLALVNSIVAAHGGTISAESVLGQGTTMTVVLPAAITAARPAPVKGH
jgi:signal transduction histidine kinase